MIQLVLHKEIAMESLNTVGAHHAEFETLMSQIKQKAYHTACRMTGNRDDAEDLLQEAYLRAFRKFDLYDRERPFENWFFRILSNAHIDALRRKPKVVTLSLDHPPGNQGNFSLEISDESSDPESLVMQEIFEDSVHCAIRVLQPEYQKTVMLCDIDGLSYAEIARVTGTNVGTVRSRLHRGRRILRLKLANYASSP